MWSEKKQERVPDVSVVRKPAVRRGKGKGGGHEDL